MPRLHQSVACLRFFGDDLDPDQVTVALGKEPTKSARKGDVRIGKNTGKEWVERSGKWLLQAADASPENLDDQIAELLDGLTDDLDVWRSIASRFKVDLFCGFFMERSNEGLSVSAESLKRLGDRGISLEMDLYGALTD